MDGFFILYLVGAAFAMLGAAFCSGVWRGTIRVPEWLFPVQGRWLRYLFGGATVGLLLFSAPVWVCLAIPLSMIFLAAMIPLVLLKECQELIADLKRSRNQPADNAGLQGKVDGALPDDGAALVEICMGVLPSDVRSCDDPGSHPH